MSKIAAINGHKFLAILQPNAYIEKPTTSQIGLETPYSQELKKQFEIIYPMIKKYAANRKINFVDMTHIYNIEEPLYFDFCHVTHQGNEILAEQILHAYNLSEKSLARAITLAPDV